MFSMNLDIPLQIINTLPLDIPSLDKPAKHYNLCSVIGIAAKYPGHKGLTGFWQTASGDQDIQSVVPFSRWDIDVHYAPETRPGKMLSSTR